MIQVRQLPNWNEERLKGWLDRNIRPHLTADISNYAKGRMRVWIGIEPPLFKDGIYQPRLQLPNFIDKTRELVEWDFDYCLLTYSGEAATGILPHRDAGTLSFEAMGLNLTGTATFQYWSDRPSFGPCRPHRTQFVPSDSPTHTIQMEPGTLVRFNSKCLHAATPSPHRWGLNLWKRK